MATSKWLVGILAFCTISAVTSAQPLFRGMNCGANGPFTSPQGDIFVADREYNASNGYGYFGDPDSMFTPLANRYNGGDEDLDSLYFSRREGVFSYLFDVPADTYAVTLYFSEKTYHWYGFRQFSVNIEGNTRVQDLDIYERTGASYGWPVRLLVECDDGQINIDLIPSLGEATLNAVSVREITEDIVPPPQIQGFEVINGYEMNILYWDFLTEPDLAGYNVYRRESGGSWELITPEAHPQYRYIDRQVEIGTSYEYMIKGVDHWGNESIPSDSLSATPVSNELSALPRYNMDMTEENLYLLNLDILSNDYVDVDLTLEGEYFPGSGVRYRGSDEHRGEEKKNYKLRLPDGELHAGRRKFNVNANFREKSMIVERIGYQSFDLLGCLNALTQSIHLELNNDFIGVFLDVEQVDNYFLERNGLSPSGNLYKCQAPLKILGSPEEYTYVYEKENNPESDYSDLINFIEWLNRSSLENFAFEAGDRFAVDDFIDIHTVAIAVAHTDLTNDFYLYNNPADGRWHYAPRDLNECYSLDFAQAPINWGTQQAPIWTPDDWHRLVNKTLLVPLFRYSYCKKLERFLNTDYTVQSVQAWIDSIHEEISFDAIRDIYKAGWERPDSFEIGPQFLDAFIEVRVPFLLGQIPSYIPPNIDLAPYFRLNEIQSDNQSTIADGAGDYDPWIEIVNLSPVELDLEDFTLYYSGSSWMLPSEAIIDGYGFLIVWLDGEPGEGPLHSTLAMTPAAGTITLESRNGTLTDSTNFPALAADQVWARSEDGVGEWAVTLLPPTPGETNTPWPDPSPLVINEFLAINISVNPDSAGDFDDWLEIYNPTGETIPLTGLYLTDNFDRPTKWAFPDTSIEPGGFVIVWCDNEVTEGWMHASFQISGEGEELGLYHRDMVTPIDAITFGEQQADFSYGRWPDGSENWDSCIPSPGGANVFVLDYPGGVSLPQEFSLEPNFPNPFNPTTVIRFTIPKLSRVLLRVYDVLGREVATLQNGMVKAGYHQVNFNGSELASGIYLIRMETEDYNQTQKVVLLK